MLFDLRSRGRRRTVQVVYLGLAILMGGGLILFGVGTGSGLGGLLNAFNNQGSSNAGQGLVSAQEKTAIKQTQRQPSNPTAWANLVQARWSNAAQGANFNPATGTFTSSGKSELTSLATDWQRYLTLTKQPDPSVAILAARAYGALGNYASEAQAWELQTIAQPGQPKGYECLAAAAYAAKQTHKGDLAAAKALSLVPATQRATLKLALQQAKTQPTIAASC